MMPRRYFIANPPPLPAKAVCRDFRERWDSAALDYNILLLLLLSRCLPRRISTGSSQQLWNMYEIWNPLGAVHLRVPNADISFRFNLKMFSNKFEYNFITWKVDEAGHGCHSWAYIRCVGLDWAQNAGIPPRLGNNSDIVGIEATEYMEMRSTLWSTFKI